jgi:hypothetical protein
MIREIESRTMKWTRSETRYAYKFVSGEPHVNEFLGDVDARIMLK